MRFVSRTSSAVSSGATVCGGGSSKLSAVAAIAGCDGADVCTVVGSSVAAAAIVSPAAGASAAAAATPSLLRGSSFACLAASPVAAGSVAPGPAAAGVPSVAPIAGAMAVASGASESAPVAGPVASASAAGSAIRAPLPVLPADTGLTLTSGANAPTVCASSSAAAGAVVSPGAAAEPPAAPPGCSFTPVAAGSSAPGSCAAGCFSSMSFWEAVRDADCGVAAAEEPSWLPSRMTDVALAECCEAPGEPRPCSAASAWSALSAPANCTAECPIEHDDAARGQVLQQRPSRHTVCRNACRKPC